MAPGAGAAVTVADLDADRARAVAEPLGGSFVGVDLADASFDARGLADGQDIIVNNAGIQHVAPVEEFPEEKFRQILALMLEAPFRLVRAALPHMYAQGSGRVVTIYLAVFLCGPGMSFASGSSYLLDGGWTAR